MSISAALGSPTGSAITRFVISRVVPTVVAATVASPLAVPMLIAGGILAAQAAWYYWGDDALKFIRDRARSKYAALNPNDSDFQATIFDIYGVHYSDCKETLMQASVEILYGYETFVNTNSSKYCGHNQNQFILKQSDGKTRYPNGLLNLEAYPFTRVEPVNQTSWNNLSEDKRRAAIDLLTTDDWEEAVGKMLQGGTLTQGQVLNSPTMLLDNAREIPSGSRVLSADQAAIVEGVMDRLKPYQDKVDEIAAIIAAAGLVGVGAGIAANTEAISNLGNTVKRASEATNSKVDAIQSEMNNKFNDLKKRYKNISLSLNIDRLLLLMTWWQTLHNCMMLSADIGRSLVSSVEVALAALPGDSLLGIPTEDPDGTPLDVGKTLSTSFEGFVKGAIGAENYAELKVELAQINRIYQATSNLLNSIQQLTNDLQNLTELCGENVSRIGNSLISSGVVGEDAYKRMPENLDTKTSWVYKLQENLEKGQQLAGNIEAIAQSVYSTEQTLLEVTQKTIEFKKAIAEVQPKQGIENKPLTEKAQTDKQDSQSPEISKADLESAPIA